LRALQEGAIRRVGETHARQVDVRNVCAPHRELAEQVRQGQFREDLFYRLQVLSLRVPPLRDRLDDILPLARHLLAQERGPAKAFSPKAEKVLLAYRWPGNVRELQNAVKYAAALSTEPTVPPELLPDEVQAPSAPRLLQGGAPKPSQRLADVERAHIQAVLESCHGSQTEAARVLGIGRNTLWRKLRQEA
jgi:two-component system response regulator HydG